MTFGYKIYMSLFENIRDRKEPANIIYQDEFITAFDDKYPVAPVHILIIPNRTRHNKKANCYLMT